LVRQKVILTLETKPKSIEDEILICTPIQQLETVRLGAPETADEAQVEPTSRVLTVSHAVGTVDVGAKQTAVLNRFDKQSGLDIIFQINDEIVVLFERLITLLPTQATHIRIDAAKKNCVLSEVIQETYPLNLRSNGVVRTTSPVAPSLMISTFMIQ